MAQIVKDDNRPPGKVLEHLTVQPEQPGDDVTDTDVIVVASGTVGASSPARIC